MCGRVDTDASTRAEHRARYAKEYKQFGLRPGKGALRLVDAAAKTERTLARLPVADPAALKPDVWRCDLHPAFHSSARLAVNVWARGARHVAVVDLDEEMLARGLG